MMTWGMYSKGLERSGFICAALLNVQGDNAVTPSEVIVVLNDQIFCRSHSSYLNNVQASWSEGQAGGPGQLLQSHCNTHSSCHC